MAFMKRIGSIGNGSVGGRGDLGRAAKVEPAAEKTRHSL